MHTVAGRLGHSGGGVTTLRVYSAFREEADQRAAAQLRDRILAGELPEGSQLPSLAEFAQTHGVAVGTAHRAITLLKTWGLVEVASGRPVVTRPTLRSALEDVTCELRRR